MITYNYTSPYKLQIGKPIDVVVPGSTILDIPGLPHQLRGTKLRIIPVSENALEICGLILKIKWKSSSIRDEYKYGDVFTLKISSAKYLEFTDVDARKCWIPASEKFMSSDEYNNSGCILQEDKDSVFFYHLDKTQMYHTIRPEIDKIIMEETMLTKIINANKAAAISAAKLETGRMANSLLNQLVLKRFPNMPDTPFNALVLANLADIAVKQFRPSPKLGEVTAAMQTAAYMELYQSMDIEGLIKDFVNQIGEIDE